MKLDDARLQLLGTPSNWAVVQAFAGAGKTRLAIEIATRFRQAPGLLVGQRILFISFSNASCLRAEESLRGSSIPADHVEVCTFHSFALSLVRRYAPRLGLAGPIRTGSRRSAAGTFLSFDEVVHHATRLLGDQDVAALLPSAYPLVIVDEFQDTSKPLLDFLRAGFVGRATVRCFGDSHQRIQPGGIDFDAHAASLNLGAEEHLVLPIPGFSRYKTPAIADLAMGFRDAAPYQASSDFITRASVGKVDEQFAHAVIWGAMKALKANRSVAIVTFSNAVVGTIADLLGTPTDKRPRLHAGTVMAQNVMAAQDEVYLALVRHSLRPQDETAEAVMAALALLTVGGHTDHKDYAGRASKLKAAWKSGKMPRLMGDASEGDRPLDLATLVEGLGPTAESLGQAVVAIWKSMTWCMTGLRSLAWRLSQVVPDGLDVRDPTTVDRLAWAWDQARRWRTYKPSTVEVMTVNQSKNREFDDVFVFIDGFQTEVRGPVSPLNRMQMYVAVSRARHSVKVIDVTNLQAKPSELVNLVMA